MIRFRFRSLAFLSAYALASSCLVAAWAATSRYTPSSDAVGSGPQGQAAAIVNLVPKGVDGAVLAKVWSDGSRDGAFRVSVQLQNKARVPLTFSPAWAEARFDGQTAVHARETETVSVAAGDGRVVELTFPFPSGKPDDAPGSAKILWSVELSGSRHTETTTFAADTPERAAPRPLRSGSQPLDREILDQQRDSPPVGVPIGPDRSRGK